MVSLNIDFQELGIRIKRILLNRLENISIEDSHLEYAWIVYALSKDGIENNPHFRRNISILENWGTTIKNKNSKYLASLGICRFLSRNDQIREKIAKMMIEILNELLNKDVPTKFSVLNDPEQVFCLSLGLKDILNNEMKSSLLTLINKNLNGRPLRKILYLAAKIELNEMKKDSIDTNKEVTDFDDIVTLLWFLKRYRKDEEMVSAWKSFENILPMIELNFTPTRTLSLLYEVIVSEIKNPNPMMLFELYPLHPELRKICDVHFKNRKYSSAIFEATKKLSEFIQERTKIYNKDFTSLAQSTMKPQSPKIIFNEFLSETAGWDEQSGLQMICEGIFKAFRNPRGHKSEDHPLLDINPFEALSQLIMIDYIFKRIENAKIKKE